MVQIGYSLSSEEHSTLNLVQQAKRAEEVGFPFALISDHYHPWIDQQGQSAFVWSVLGAISQVTNMIEIGTGITCPLIRIHPAIIAQAAATIATMMPGRFFLTVGTGERLNEHITGEHWPPFEVRLEMLDEAIDIIQMLWQGGNQSFYGQYYTVENARVYSLPDQLPKLMIAASGPKAAEFAGRLGDGLVSTTPDAEIVKAFSQPNDDRPKYGQMTICWAKDEDTAKKIAYQYWPIAAVEGPANQEFALPSQFEELAKNVTEDDMADAFTLGNDPQKHLDAIQKYADAGFDHIYVHQVGPDQEGFFQFYQQQILPEFNQEKQKA